MEDHTLKGFKRWNEVQGYESDSETVTLTDKKNIPIAIFSYRDFTSEDYEYFKKIN